MDTITLTFNRQTNMAGNRRKKSQLVEKQRDIVPKAVSAVLSLCYKQQRQR